MVGARDAEADAPPGSIVHKLQLISGRLLYTVPLPAKAGPARFADVALTASGTVVTLDSLGSRIFQLGSEAKSFGAATALKVSEPTSIAPAGETVVYVAHASGVLRMDLASGGQLAVQAVNDVDLRGLHWIRWYEGALIGIQAGSDGSLAAVRIRLDRRGRRVLSREVLGAAASSAATVIGGGLYYVGSQADGEATMVRKLDLN